MVHFFLAVLSSGEGLVNPINSKKKINETKGRVTSIAQLPPLCPELSNITKGTIGELCHYPRTPTRVVL